MTRPVKFAPAPGSRFGRLTILAEQRLPNTPGRERRGFTQGLRGYRCACDCGAQVLVGVPALASGGTRSCGCLRAEKASGRIPQMAVGNRTHGLAGKGEHHHPLYDTWWGMMARCENPGHKWYKHYGGRGIRVCERWHDPALFVADIERWLGPKPRRASLDRIQNDHDYRLDNVQWAAQTQQMRNRRPLPRKIPGEQIIEMCQRREAGETLAALAAAFGVSTSAVHRYTKGVRPGTPRRGLKPLT